MAGESLYLDPQIRDWVLFPITLVMILVGILRNNVVQLLASSPKKLTRKAIREQRALLRSQILRNTAKTSPLPPSFFEAHTNELVTAFQEGTYISKPVELDEHGNKIAPSPTSMLTDPAAMEGMMGNMKNQVVMMVPQMVIMGWINFFFQGFVLIKLPFPLTLGFKSMLQRGIETPDMDVRWVSSLSWYFLNWFGLNGLYRVLLGDGNAASDKRDLASSPFGSTGGAPAAGPTQDFNKAFIAESESLQIAEGIYKWVGEGIDERILRKYGKLAA